MGEYDKIADAITHFSEEEAVAAAEEILKAGADPIKAVNAMGDAMKALGVKFQTMEVFLPEIIMASDALKAAMDILGPKIIEAGASSTAEKRPKVIMGTVKGDVHTVGKDMVSTMLMTAGFDVKDLGPDVAPSTFLNEAKAEGAELIGASALMSTTLPVQKDLIDFLEAKGVRQNFKVLVGGGVATKEWSETIGADGYGQDAVEGVAVAKKLTGI